MKSDTNTKAPKEKVEKKVRTKLSPKTYSIRDDESESNFDAVAKTSYMKHKRL
jgi:hypothetical protein